MKFKICKECGLEVAPLEYFGNHCMHEVCRKNKYLVYSNANREDINEKARDYRAANIVKILKQRRANYVHKIPKEKILTVAPLRRKIPSEAAVPLKKRQYGAGSLYERPVDPAREARKAWARLQVEKYYAEHPETPRPAQ